VLTFLLKVKDGAAGTTGGWSGAPAKPAGRIRATRRVSGDERRKGIPMMMSAGGGMARRRRGSRCAPSLPQRTRHLNEAPASSGEQAEGGAAEAAVGNPHLPLLVANLDFEFLHCERLGELGGAPRAPRVDVVVHVLASHVHERTRA